jgi:predicted RNA-binding Zn-ribbon protein involved in translation (DUF1610 family)
MSSCETRGSMKVDPRRPSSRTPTVLSSPPRTRHRYGGNRWHRTILDRPCPKVYCPPCPFDSPSLAGVQVVRRTKLWSKNACVLCAGRNSPNRGSKLIEQTPSVFDCPACGRFEIIGQLLTYWDEGELDEQDRTLLINLPAAVRRRNDAGKLMTLTFDNWRAIAGTK